MSGSPSKSRLPFKIRSVSHSKRSGGSLIESGRGSKIMSVSRSRRKSSKASGRRGKSRRRSRRSNRSSSNRSRSSRSGRPRSRRIKSGKSRRRSGRRGKNLRSARGRRLSGSKQYRNRLVKSRRGGKPRGRRRGRFSRGSYTASESEFSSPWGSSTYSPSVPSSGMTKSASIRLPSPMKEKFLQGVGKTAPPSSTGSKMVLVEPSLVPKSSKTNA